VARFNGRGHGEAEIYLVTVHLNISTYIWYLHISFGDIMLLLQVVQPFIDASFTGFG
jgi:hypothetical protein